MLRPTCGWDKAEYHASRNGIYGTRHVGARLSCLVTSPYILCICKCYLLQQGNLVWRDGTGSDCLSLFDSLFRHLQLGRVLYTLVSTLLNIFPINRRSPDWLSVLVPLN